MKTLDHLEREMDDNDGENTQPKVQKAKTQKGNRERSRQKHEEGKE